MPKTPSNANPSPFFPVHTQFHPKWALSGLLPLLPRHNRIRAAHHRLNRATRLLDIQSLAEAVSGDGSGGWLGGGVCVGFALRELFCGGGLGGDVSGCRVYGGCEGRGWGEAYRSSVPSSRQSEGEDEKLDEEEEHAREQGEMHLD